MQKLLAGFGFAAVLAFAMPAAAQTGGVVAASAPGKAGVAQTVKVTATITAIDSATRDVTLKGPKGNELTVTAGPEVKNFASMKVGDQVERPVHRGADARAEEGRRPRRGAHGEKGATGAKPGEKPAGVAGRQVTIVADVVGLDPATQTVTLKGPKRTVDLHIADPEQFKRIAKGDQVEATYTQALAIAVEPAAKK